MVNALLALFVFFSQPNQVDDGTGIFLTIECHKHIPKKQSMLSEGPVCITPHPIIDVKDFGSVSPVKEFGDNVFFELTLSDKGSYTLLTLRDNLAESSLALVVREEVFFVFNVSNVRGGRTLRFQVDTKYRNQAENAQRRLVEAMGSASR